MEPVAVHGSHLGFQLLIQNTTLQDHLINRRDFHKKRIDFYKGKLTGLDNVLDDDDDPMVKNYSGSQSPIDAIRQRILVHEKKLAYFSFLVQNVVSPIGLKVYTLTRDDLSSFEVGEIG